jgi:hypothetical protein
MQPGEFAAIIILRNRRTEPRGKWRSQYDTTSSSAARGVEKVKLAGGENLL